MKRLPPETVERILDLRDQGSTTRNIANEVECSYSTVLRYMNPEARDKNRLGAQRQRQHNPERNREACRRWREENREKHRLAVRHWYEKNRERLLDQNRDQRLESYRCWREENREAHRRHRREYKARKLNQLGPEPPTPEWEHTQRYILQQNRCYFCYGWLEEPHLEHLTPLSRGGLHDISNLAWSCVTCNLSKKSLTEEEFYNSSRFTERLLNL